MSIRRAVNIFGMFLVLSTLTLFLSCGGGGSSSSSEPTKALTEEEEDSLAINEFWDSFENLYKTAAPSDEALWEWLNSHATEDYFDAGYDKTDKLAEPPEGIEIGATFSAAIIESVSSTKYAKVYRISLRMNNGWEEQETIMVYDGTQWLWQGNQAWVDYDISAYALMGSSQREQFMYTGFEIELSGNGMFLTLMEVNSAFVTGPGLPERGLIYSFNEIHGEFEEWGWNSSDLIFEDESHDAQLSAIPDNAEYTFNLCMNTAPELAVMNNMALTATILKSYKRTLKKGPVPSGDLTWGMFATITPPFYDISDLKIGGPVTLNVSVPAGTRPGWVLLGYSSDSGKQVVMGCYETGSASISVDTTGKPAPNPETAGLYFSVTDAYDREFRTGCFFQ